MTTIDRRIRAVAWINFGVGAILTACGIYTSCTEGVRADEMKLDGHLVMPAELACVAFGPLLMLLAILHVGPRGRSAPAAAREDPVD